MLDLLKSKIFFIFRNPYSDKNLYNKLSLISINYCRSKYIFRFSRKDLVDHRERKKERKSLSSNDRLFSSSRLLRFSEEIAWRLNRSCGDQYRFSLLFYLYRKRDWSSTGITINRCPSIDFHGNQLHRGNSNSRLISVWYHSSDAPLFFLLIVNVSIAYHFILFFDDL